MRIFSCSALVANWNPKSPLSKLVFFSSSFLRPLILPRYYFKEVFMIITSVNMVFMFITNQIFSIIIVKTVITNITIVTLVTVIKHNNRPMINTKKPPSTSSLRGHAKVRHIYPNNISFFGKYSIFFLFADSVQTEYCSTFLLSVRLFVTGVTSHIFHIYKGINASLIIRGPI